MEILGVDWSLIEQWWMQVVAYAETRWLPTLLVMAAALLVRWLARQVLKIVDRVLAKRTATTLDDHGVKLLHSLANVGAMTWAVWRILGLWGGDQAATWSLAVGVAWAFFPLARFVSDALAALEGQIMARTGAQLGQTALPLVNRVVRFVVIGAGVLIALHQVGVTIAPLMAGAGVMGLAFSLAARDTLSNLIAGVLLIIDRPFQVGDRIELWTAPTETGTWGDVIEVGLRATKIRNPDNLVVVVPNNEIMRRDIVNYTMAGSAIRLRIPYTVSYEADIERAKQILRGIALEVAGVKADPDPVVIVRGFGPSEVRLELRIWISQARERRRVGDEITEKVLTAFADAEIEIPYPKRELLVRDSKGLLPAAVPSSPPRDDL